MIVLLIIALTLQVADAWTTYRALSRPGAREVNPLVASLLGRLGLVGGLALAKLLGVGAVTLAYVLDSAFALYVLIVLYTAVVANNINVLRSVRP